jgi:hypothetical protein
VWRFSSAYTVRTFWKAPSSCFGRHVLTPYFMMGKWCRLEDSNPRPTDYKSAALPTELSRQLIVIKSFFVLKVNLKTSIDNDGGNKISERRSLATLQNPSVRALPIIPDHEFSMANAFADRPYQLTSLTCLKSRQRVSNLHRRHIENEESQKGEGQGFKEGQQESCCGELTTCLGQGDAVRDIQGLSGSAAP